MPIITAMVPQKITIMEAGKIREEITRALEGEGVNPNEITVEFTPCVFPERLVIYYFSRSSHLNKGGQRGKEAEIIGSIFQAMFGLEVKCLVTSLEMHKTGIYVS